LLLQILDGPYIAFVASVKLEGAYLAISQRDVEAEAEEARLRKLQEELEWEEKIDKDILKKLAEGESEKSLVSWLSTPFSLLKQGKREEEGLQQEQRGLGATISQAERGDSGR
jgi:hypothetical protein